MKRLVFIFLLLFLAVSFSSLANAESNDPSVSITNPSNNAQVVAGSEVAIETTASSSAGVNRVVFHVDGVHQCTDYSAPYSCTWDISQTLGITYKLTAWVIDNNGRKNSSSVSVTTSQPLLVGAALQDYSPPIEEDCTINVPSQHSTIKAGIDAAAIGDTVCVGAGTYNEDILIDKSIRLSGKGAFKSVINGQGPDWPGAVYITAKNVIFEGFFISGVGTNSTVQLDVRDSPYNSTLQYNWMKAGYGGMALQLDGFQNTLVQNNILEGNNSPHVARESGGSSGRVDFLNNTFIGTVNPNTRSDTGITLDAGLPNSLIKQNAFNTTGTMIAIIAPNGTTIINENNFDSNTTIKVSNGWPTTVNAENNWWGDLDPSDNIQGYVDFTPFATSPFAEN